MNRLRRIGLTNRLVALVISLLVLSGVIVGVATTLALRSFLTQRLDAQLAAAGVRYSVSLEHPDDHDADNATFGSTVGQASGTLGARLLAGRVTSVAVVDPGSDHGVPSVADRAALAGLSVTKHPRTVRLPELGEYRVSVRPGRDGDVLVTGLPMREVTEPVHHLIATEGIVFAVVIAVAGLIGAGVIRRGLGPLARIAAAAHGVSALPLASGSVVLPSPVANPRPGSEIGAVTTAFNLMLERVQAALEQRHTDEGNLRLFIADASHELRTPVAVIASQAEYAQREGEDDPAAVAHALARIRAETARMGHLVDDLLLLARLDLDRPVVRAPLDLSRTVLDAVADAARIAPEHHWQLDLPPEPVIVDGDEGSLHQAVANLLANARAHTPAGTTVRATVAPGTDRVAVSVHDDGPGIAPDLLAHVFERFTRGGQSPERVGAGLGLAITDGIIRAHGGRISATSQPGDTSFLVELPSVPSAAPPGSPPATPVGDPHTALSR